MEIALSSRDTAEEAAGDSWKTVQPIFFLSSLLVVTETIGSELLSTFVVNAFKGTLPVCVVHPLRDRSGRPAPGRQFATPPTAPDQLLRIDEVWIRRTATVCFPNPGDPLASTAAVQNFAIIETGGENHEDQYDRLRFLMRALQR